MSGPTGRRVQVFRGSGTGSAQPGAASAQLADHRSLAPDEAQVAVGQAATVPPAQGVLGGGELGDQLGPTGCCRGRPSWS